MSNQLEQPDDGFKVAILCRVPWHWPALMFPSFNRVGSVIFADYITTWCISHGLKVLRPCSAGGPLNHCLLMITVADLHEGLRAVQAAVEYNALLSECCIVAYFDVDELYWRTTYSLRESTDFTAAVGKWERRFGNDHCLWTLWGKLRRKQKEKARS